MLDYQQFNLKYTTKKYKWKIKLFVPKWMKFP